MHRAEGNDDALVWLFVVTDCDKLDGAEDGTALLFGAWGSRPVIRYKEVWAKAEFVLEDIESVGLP